MNNPCFLQPNNISIIEKKKSILVPGANPRDQIGTDNTLTLIFDSDEERFDENDDKFDEPEI